MTSLLNISIALLAGLLMTRVFNLWNLPDVTAFLTAGLLIGPCALGRLGIPGLGFPTYDNVEALSLLSDVAMGFIAFSIGNEFLLSQLKAIGKQAGEELNFGGLLGYGPIMKVNTLSPAVFVHRGGQIPAPIQALKN